MGISRTIGTVGGRVMLLSAFVIAGLLFATGTARASHAVDVNFVVDSQNFFPGPAPSDAHAFGHVEAGPSPCQAGRTFKLFKNQNPGIRIDTGRSSTNGFWALGGNLSGATSVLITMSRKRFGPRRNRHTCTGDSAGYQL